VSCDWNDSDMTLIINVCTSGGWRAQRGRGEGEIDKLALCSNIKEKKHPIRGGEYTLFSFPMIVRILPQMWNEHRNKICYRIRIIVITINVLFSVGYMHKNQHSNFEHMSPKSLFFWTKQNSYLYKYMKYGWRYDSFVFWKCIPLHQFLPAIALFVLFCSFFFLHLFLSISSSPSVCYCCLFFVILFCFVKCIPLCQLLPVLFFVECIPLLQLPPATSMWFWHISLSIQLMQNNIPLK